MKITQDVPGGILTPSFTGSSISKSNKKGDFSTLKWLLLVLVFTFLLLFYFSKPNKMEFYQGKLYSREAYVKLVRSDDLYKYNPICSVKKDEVLKEVETMNNSTSTAVFSEKDIYGIPSEGTNVKYYRYNNNRELIQVASFAALARFFTNYYVKNGDIFYVEQIIDEWDLKKLHGEHGELSSSEGEYVIGTSTKESYLLENKLLCQVITDRPRQQSAAVAASNPDEALDLIFSLYDEYLK